VADAPELIGKPTPPQAVVIERGPVSYFAKAVTDNSPIHQHPDAAAEAGFDAIPAPPTYAFAFQHMGAYPEIQPEGSSDVNPVMHAIGALMKEGGLVLHGEQEFVYHRPVLVGDKLTSQGTIKDIYSKEGSSGTMTFVVTETDWLDESGEKVVTAIMTLIHRA